MNTTSARPRIRSEFQVVQELEAAERKTYTDGYRACGAVNAFDLTREFARGVSQGMWIGLVLGVCIGVTFTIVAAPLIAHWWLT